MTKREPEGEKAGGCDAVLKAISTCFETPGFVGVEGDE